MAKKNKNKAKNNQTPKIDTQNLPDQIEQIYEKAAQTEDKQTEKEQENLLDAFMKAREACERFEKATEKLEKEQEKLKELQHRVEKGSQSLKIQRQQQDLDEQRIKELEKGPNSTRTKSISA